MNVRLIAITQSVIPECKTPSELLGYCARVSSVANQLKHETTPRLLKYLVRNSEWSPFEMVSMTVEVETTREIAHQMIRHKSFSFQEFSQRYAAITAPPVFRDARLQDLVDRQNSIETEDPGLQLWWREAQEEVAEVTRRRYTQALSRGIAKEVSRSLLPEGQTKATLYMAGVLRSWIHYCGLRETKKTQKEHREIAIACKAILLKQFPDLANVLS